MCFLTDAGIIGGLSSLFALNGFGKLGVRFGAGIIVCDASWFGCVTDEIDCVAEPFDGVANLFDCVAGRINCFATRYAGVFDVMGIF